MPELSEVEIKIKTDADNKGIDEAESRILGFSKKSTEAFGKLSLGIAGVAVGVGAAALSFVGDFTAQEDSLARLQAGINNVHSERNKDISALTAQADALQKTTRFADEQIESGQAMLTTFQLNKSTIKTLTPSMLDMAEAMRKTTGETVDLNSLGIMFGKVMGNAEGGVEGLATGLKKMGVIMTDEEAAVFKFGTETERAAQLTKIMDTNFGGFAAAGGKTFSGRMDIMNNQFGEVKEAIGGMVANALSPLVEILSKNVVPWFEKMNTFLSEHKTVATAVAIIIGTVVVAAFLALGIAAASAAIGVIAASWPILAIVAAIGVGVALLYLAWNSNFLGIRDVVQLVFAWITGTAIPWLQVAFTNVMIFLQALGDFFVFIWGWIKTAVSAVVDWFNTYVVPVLEFVWAVIRVGLTLLYNYFLIQWNLIMAVVKVVVGWFNTYVAPVLKAVWGEIEKGLKVLSSVWETIWNGIKKVVLDITTSIIGAVKSMVNSVIGFFNGLIRGANKVGGKVPGWANIPELPTFAEGVQNFRGGWAMVGERGPELVNLPRGSNVIPNDRLGGGKEITVNQYIQSPVDMDFMFRELAFVLRTT